MYNNNGFGMPYGCSDSLSGVGGLLVLLLFLGLAGNGNGLGFGGNRCQPDIATAGATTTMMQDNATRAQVAEIAARQQFNQPFFGSLSEGQVRTREDIARLDTHLCQLGNDRSSQVNNLRYDVMDKFCEVKHDILDSERRITDLINANRVEDLKSQLAESKERYNTLQLNCSQGAQTAQLDAKLDAIARSIPQPPQPTWPAPCPAPTYAYGACNPGGVNCVAEQQLAALNRIAGSLVTLNQGQEQMATALANQATAIANLQTSVNRIPVTTATAA